MSPVTLIGLGIIGVFGVIFYFYNKKQSKLEESKKSSDKNSSKKGTDNKKSEEVKKDDVFNFMEFDKILDGMIVQNNGTKYTMAIKCKGINYDLMSDVEQMAVEEGFITFLNTLRYPIQLYVQAQNIDLKNAISQYKQHISGIEKEYNDVNVKYQRVAEAFESSEEDIEKVERERSKVQNVYEYASDIVNYVERLSQNKGLLQRSFYVLVSYYTSELNISNAFSKDEIVDMCYTELLTRVHGIISALAGCSVEGKLLDSNGLADLLYNAYNRDDKGLIDVKDAIDSGFYRLYSTSKDVYFKKLEKLDKEIDKEAKIKAYKAIKDSIEKGTYISPKIDDLNKEEDISRLATEIVKREDVPVEVKKEAQKNIVEEYRQTKRKAISDITKEKQELLEEADTELSKLDPNYNKTTKLNSNSDTEKLKENNTVEKNNENVTVPDSKITETKVENTKENIAKEIDDQIFDDREFDEGSEDDSII